MAKKKYIPIYQNQIFLIVVLALFLMTIVTLLTPHNTEAQKNAVKELTPKYCNHMGSPVINVTQKVENSADSGEGGNYWALDTYTRTIQVWREDEHKYCALVNYQGRFDSQADQKSPGNTGILTGKEDGTFKGGYSATILGALKDKTTYALKGSLKTVNYNCDMSGNCPGAVNWVNVYFGPTSDGPLFTYDWWGWQYKYQNHTWVNSSDGNSGDII